MPHTKLKLGAQLYTVREYMKTEDDFKRTMEKIATIGYRYVQVSGIGEVPPQRIKESAEANGIKVILTHMPPERVLNETEKVIGEHDLLGCGAIGIGGLVGAERNEEGYKTFAANFASAIEKIKKSGKLFCYHNHRFEFEKYNGLTGLDILLANTDKDAFKLTFDTYWAHSGGIDCAAFIEKYHGRIFSTHLKDMTVINDSQEMTEIYTGNMNFDAILKASAENGVIYHFVEQDTVRMDAFDSMKISYDNLMKTGMFK